MKTQISRDSYHKDKRYSGIYQQQGRMLTDADWNELVDLLKGHMAEALMDVIGDGAPRTGAVTITDDRRIKPGDLYVDGVRAEVPGHTPFEANNQPDFPGFQVLPAAGPYVVYADVWQRSVTCLEDSELRDAGLHGADTCTRTQTMLQVKWCSETTDPEADIPQKGNALLYLDLHTSMESNDPCDPCAGLVAAGEGRVGNYLFRVEVHEVNGSADNPDKIVLKWSGENGSEQFEGKTENKMPPGFISGKHVYEFFNLTSEKQLGVHLAAGFTPARGILAESYEIPEGDSEPKEFVRRWDGYCVIERSASTWSLKNGRDKGVELSTTVAPTAPGYVSLGPGLRANLEALLLSLDLTGRTFVAGDYWLAPVREEMHGPGSVILGGIEPQGSVHHYLRLARVDSGGAVQRFLNDADRRRHSFPPLTDIRAHDVGYETDCDSGLFDASQDNVKKALDRLCELAAEHIFYQADCADGLFKNFDGTVKQALDRICEIQAQHVGFNKPCDTSLYQGKTVATVHDALALLCEIQADQVFYQSNPECALLNEPGIHTVQEAIDKLCQLGQGGGCAFTVGAGGQYETLEEAFAALQETRDICFCLLPGNHEIDNDLLVTGKNSIKITGCATGSGIQQSSQQFLLSANQILMRDIVFNVSNEVGRVILEGNEVTAEGCTFVRTVGQEGTGPLVSVGPGAGVADLRWRNNRLVAWWVEAIPQSAGEYLMPASDVPIPEASRRHLQKLAKTNPYIDKHAFAEVVESVVQDIKALSSSHRAAWSNKRPAAKIRALSSGPRGAIEKFYASIKRAQITTKTIRENVEAVIKTFYVFHYTEALALEGGVGGLVEDNIINGYVALHYGGKYRSLNWGRTNEEQQANKQNWADQNQYIVVDPVHLSLRGNDFYTVRSNAYSIMQVIEPIINTGQWPNELPEEGYKTINVAENVFRSNGSSFVCESIVMNGNHFPGAITGSTIAAFVLGYAGVFMGNVAPTQDAVIEKILKSGRAREAANLLEIV